MKMTNRKILPLLLAGFLALSVSSTLPAHAQAGVLYVSPSVTPSMAVGSTFSVKIQVANIDPFNAWDISVQSDPTVVSPQSLTITGNLLAINFTTTVFELINCINGIGTGCIATDGAGIAHSAVTGFGPPPQTTTSSGLLFTITYKVIASGTSAIHIFNDVIANGATGVSVPHTAVDGVYSPTPFSYSLSNSGGITVTQGGSGSNTITATLTGGTTQSVTLSCSSGLPSGASCAFTPSPSGSPTFSATLTISTLASTPAGTSTITVTGTPLGLTTAPTTFTLTVLPIPGCNFVHGKLSWTHHLSLAKNPAGQTFTAHVRCDTTGPEFVQVSVVGMNGVGGMFSAMSPATSVQPGVVTDITFSQAVPTSFVDTKIAFTSSLTWGDTAATVTANSSPITKSGAFAVVA